MDVSKLLKEMTAGQGAILVPHIEHYLERATYEGSLPDVWRIEIRNYKPEDGHFHPSSHAFMPLRNLYFDMQDRRAAIEAPTLLSAQMRKTYDCGHMWHGYLQAILTEMGFVEPDHVEMPVLHEIQTPYGATVGAGTIDLFDVLIPGADRWLVDIKTMSKRMFEEGLPEHMLRKYEAQVNLYADWVGRHKIMILAVEKDSPHRFKEIQIQKNPVMIDEIYKRWTMVETGLKHGVEPPCTHAPEKPCGLGSRCSYV